VKVLQSLFSSRKFVATLLGLTGAVAAELGLPEEHASEVARIIVAAVGVYVGGTALEDAAMKRSPTVRLSDKIPEPPEQHP